MPPVRSAAFDRLRKPYERPAAEPKGRSDGKWAHDKAPGVSAPSNRLIVTNLHWEVTEQDLQNLFGTIGTLASKPVIRFDRSGRSTGVGYVEYSAPAEAIRALNQLNGKIAKSQAMAIAYAPPRVPRGARVSAKHNGPESLLNRITKPNLLSRISAGEKAVAEAASGPGPIRTRTRGGPRGRGGRGGAAARTARAPKKDQTAEELDKELEAFMGTGAEPITAEKSTVEVSSGDVEMS